MIILYSRNQDKLAEMVERCKSSKKRYKAFSDEEIQMSGNRKEWTLGGLYNALEAARNYGNLTTDDIDTVSGLLKAIDVNDIVLISADDTKAIGKNWNKKEPPKDAFKEVMLKGRIRAVKKRGAKSGAIPYGYRRERYRDSNNCYRNRLVINEQEAKTVKMIFKLYLNLRSMTKVRQHLNTLGYKTRRGINWSQAGIAWILKNDTYRGYVRYGEVWSRGHHKPLVSWQLWQRVQELINKNRKLNRNKV